MKNEEIKTNPIILSEENIKEIIYEIRGQRVMLDFDLARIYGYETRDFNNQVKNNIKKFPEDFAFILSNDEWRDILRWKNSTANTALSKRRSLPKAFTEKGIYMLMTILRGELATQQSIALIRLFQDMKEYIVQSSNLFTTNEVLKLSRQVNENTMAIAKLKELKVYVQDKLKVVMDNFINPSTYKQFVIFNGNKIEADIAYKQIYSLAKKSIIVLDDYISFKTLEHLKVAGANVKITILSDNVAKTKITKVDLEDFHSDTGKSIALLPTKNIVHDRYILLDYNTESELMYMCGPSEKDAGKKVGAIIQIIHSKIYHVLIDDLLNQK